MWLTGCGDDVKKASPAVIVNAAEKSSASGTARIEMQANFDAGVQAFEMTGEGVVDNETQRARMSIDMSDVADIVGQDPEEFRGEQITHGFVTYMNVPAFTSQAGASTPWVKIDLEKANEMQGIDINQFAGPQNDPTQMLSYLEGVADDVEELGGDEVDGRDTTHYRAEIDFRKLPETRPPEEQEAARRSVERLIELTGSDTVSTDVWVDEEDLVRRMLIEMSLDVQGVALDIDMTMDFPEYGVEPGNLEAPPEDQVTDISQ